jgi:hypothetical protein
MLKQAAFIVTIWIATLSGQAQDYTQTSRLVRQRSDGRLVYAKDADGFLLPDFSYSGYHKGEKTIPAVSVKKEISPVSGDNTAHIQAAIDEVGRLPKDAQGIRGALLLKAGAYEVKGTILVNYEGVILRGEGSDKTIIEVTGNSPADRDAIILGTDAAGNTTDDNYWLPLSNTRQNITDDIVPAGALSFIVANASDYQVGDRIVIYHPCTGAWVDAVDGGGSQDATERWSEGQVPIYYNRYITAKTANRITVDAPVYYTLNKAVSQCSVYKTGAVFLQEIGIENLRVDIKGSGSSHAQNAIRFKSAENCWAKNVIVSGFSLSGFITESCTRTSILNCEAVQPIAPGGSGYKYNFNTYAFSQLILFQNCYSQGGRHNFISNGTSATSGIVFQNCTGDGALETSEGHRHWTQGMLFDGHKEINIDSGNAIVLGLYNRNKSGSGHGYGAAQSVLWNCDVTEGAQGIICLHQPPTSQNYAIGCIAGLLSGDPGMASRRFPEGYIESHNIPITDILSLYAAQLSDRKANGNIRVEVKPENIDESIKGYVSKHHLIEEGFNGTTWGSAQGGSSVPINIQGVGQGNMLLHADCVVATTDSKGQKNGGFSLGSINLNGQGSDKKGVTLEFPEIPSCATVTVTVKCNSGKTLILQKKANGRWGAVGENYISADGAYESHTFVVNSTTPVTLRLNSELSSNFYIFDLLATDFVQGDDPVDPDPDDADVEFLRYVNFSTEPGVFKAIGQPGTFANGTQNGFHLSNVILDPNKQTASSTGSVILQGTTGSIELPEVKNAGLTTIVAASENAGVSFLLEQKINDNWMPVKEFTIVAANNLAEYAQDVASESDCKLRITNTGSAALEIYAVLVEALSNEEPPIHYDSKLIIHEQFNATFNNNAANWADKTEGNYSFVIPVGTGTGTISLTKCEVGTENTQTGASSNGRVRFIDASSIVELPEIAGCGLFTMSVNAGTATGKSVTLQKKSGNDWTDVRTFSLTDVPATQEHELNLPTPVKLRLITKQAGAKNIYELWISDYTPVITAIEKLPVEQNKGEIVAIFYYDLRGIRLQGKPASPGIFIQKTIYANGAVETIKKVIRND